MKWIPFLLGIACVGMALGLPNEALAQKVRGEITVSEFDRKLKDAREAAFHPWMPHKEANVLMGRSEIEKKIVLAYERNSAGQARSIIYFPPDGKGADIAIVLDLTEDDLLERHVQWDRQGFNLLYTVKNLVGGTYAAIWIKSDRYGVAVKRLNELGISAGVIRLKGDAAGGASPPPVVTAPLREWRDKTGRIIKASVEGVDGAGVKFVLGDGRRFTVPLASLSDADRQYLAELEKKLTAPPPPAASEGMTDWMLRAKFEAKNTEEMAKGRYLIYVESNSRNELRGIYEPRPEGWGLFLAWHQPEPSLREQDASYKARGFKLLSLSQDRRTDHYCAVWVGERMFETAKTQLGIHGITTGSIEEKITVSTVPKR